MGLTQMAGMYIGQTDMIMMVSPKVQLFNAVFKLSQGLQFKTYDYLPNADAPYPFVHVAQSISQDNFTNKDIITGNISQTVHVWGYANNKALFADMVWNIEQELRRLTALENYYVRLVALNSNEIVDNTTTHSLLHGVIEAEFRIT